MCQVNTQHFLPFFHQMIDCILSFLKKYKFSPIWNEFKLLRMMWTNEMKMRNEMLSMRKSNVIFLFVNSFNKHFISWISIYLLTFSLFHFISQTLFIFFNIHKDCVRRKGKWKKKFFLSVSDYYFDIFSYYSEDFIIVNNPHSLNIYLRS